MVASHSSLHELCASFDLCLFPARRFPGTICVIRMSSARSTFRSFYICQAGGANPCLTAISSETWATKHDDPLASKQRWYCICCGALYKTKFGTIIEIEFEGQFYYVKAFIPPDNLRARRFEQPPTSREDLLDTLKNVAPHASRIMRPITIDDVYGWGQDQVQV
jgi:hypothetical protein